MCGHKNTADTASSSDAPFVGETQRLALERRRGGFCAFPWWTLWLIWPLIGLFKSIAALIAHSWLALGTFSIPLNMVIAVALIGAGTGLLLWQRARATGDKR